MPDICDHANDEMEFLNLMDFLNQITLSRPHPPSQPSANIAVTAIDVRHYRASGDAWIASPSWNIPPSNIRN